MPAECVGPETFALLFIINSSVPRLGAVSENSIKKYGGMCLHTQSHTSHELHIYGTRVTTKGRPSSNESTILGGEPFLEIPHYYNEKYVVSWCHVGLFCIKLN